LNKIFKPTVEIRRELQKVIERYKQAAYSDKSKVETICLSAGEFLKEKLNLDSVSFLDGTLTDEQFSIMFTKDEASVEITFKDFLQCYTAEVRTSEQENLLQYITSLGLLDIATAVNQLVQEEFVAAQMESPALAEGYTEAKHKMELIQQRQQATLKWFLIPALLQEEDILRFLKSLDERQLKIVTEEMCIDPEVKDIHEKIINALTI
jgi:hypothetical protein